MFGGVDTFFALREVNFMNYQHFYDRHRDTCTWHLPLSWTFTMWGVLLCHGAWAAADDLDPVALFQRTEEEFLAARSPKDYRRVAARYQELLENGYVCGAVLYNQGNAYLRAGERARAIAAYRHAQRYLPRDPHLEANLRFALGENVTSTIPLFERLFFWQNWLSYPEKIPLAMILTALTLIGAWVAQITGHAPISRLVAVGVLFSLLTMISATYDWYRFEYQRHGILTEAVTARKGNADSFEPAFTQPLPESTECLLLEERDEWLRLRFGDGLEGWVRRGSVVLY